ncbi:MAG: hypothetical protein A2234_01310 [Elusimicrobia bacterium RIFOXYA2_FULL_58_8]|nr:MAG: hypothetical protein A2285_06455 [Elusimicrobia bacterium RIFOXYA12_FULL_57_11]OGS15353.1 MAG: hypothetical protein A2234_01310 [Elusimicrobia bacterium RIFOXYA2_FULL_58_8]
MKNTFKILLAGFMFLPVLFSGAYAEDKYDQLAKEITSAGEAVHGKKIAIIPFSYADGRAGATKDGSVISERLTIKMINMHKFEIIERSVLDKVMSELKLQSSGMIDASSAQQLGKVLGVEAIVTGTLVEMQAGEIEVNARLIKTETAQAIGASQVSVKKDWMGDAATVPQQPAYQQPVYQQAAYQQPVQAAPRVRGEYEYGFFEFVAGGGSQTTDIKWDVARWAGVEQTALVTSGAGPLGFRVGGFGKGAFGGAFEFSISKHYVEAQRAVLNNVLLPLNLPAGYIDATSIGISGDLLLRTMTKAQFYLGIGLGMSINNIKSSAIRDIRNVLLNETAIGFMFRVPVGIRFNMDNTTFFLEGRMEMNSTSFTRGSASETNSLTFVGARGVFGVGTKF